jgi:phosphoribosylamine---glycine ligase
VVFAEENAIDFVIVGPEAPLAAGVSDRLREAGLLVFGPSRRGGAARGVEGLHQGDLRRLRRAHRRLGAVLGRRAPRKAHVRAKGAPIVVKADGLAAGKGVVVADDAGRGRGGAVDDMFGGAFGAAGAEVVIEEFMEGEEASFFVLCDGDDVLAIGTAQDHKRVGEGDTGPNTGGMGAYSPAPGPDRGGRRPRRWTRSCAPPWPRWRGAARPIRACSTPG